MNTSGSHLSRGNSPRSSFRRNRDHIIKHETDPEIIKFLDDRVAKMCRGPNEPVFEAHDEEMSLFDSSKNAYLEHVDSKELH